MTRTAQEPAAYQVAWPMIQILGHVPFSGQHQTHERILRQGDIVPDWVPTAEITRLLEGGFIEEMS